MSKASLCLSPKHQKSLFKNLSKYLSNHLSKFLSKHLSKYLSKHLSKKLSKQLLKKLSKILSKYLSKHLYKHLSKNTSKNLSKNHQQQVYLRPGYILALAPKHSAGPAGFPLKEHYLQLLLSHNIRVNACRGSVKTEHHYIPVHLTIVPIRR